MEQEKKPSIFARPIVQSITGIIVIALVFVGVIVYKSLSSRIVIDRSSIEAPVISIGPEQPGILDVVYVHIGESVTAGEELARVGGEILSAKVSGVVIDVINTPGQVFAPSQAVVRMIDPTELRIVGIIKETEGLASIKVGQPVSFTVDAFSGQTYTGIVENVSPTSNESGVAFSISDKREIKEFDVKVSYDIKAHPEFKNGMSAKMNVYDK